MDKQKTDFQIRFRGLKVPDNQISKSVRIAATTVYLPLIVMKVLKFLKQECS